MGCWMEVVIIKIMLLFSVICTYVIVWDVREHNHNESTNRNDVEQYRDINTTTNFSSSFDISN